MKWSVYNMMWQSLEGHYLLYNSLSNTFAAAEPATGAELKKIRENPESYDFSGNPALLLQLRRAKVLVADDEEQDLLNLNQLSRNLDNLRNDVLALTIVPTLACNFRCTYCYQRHKRPVRMTDAVQAQLLHFIKRFKLFGQLRHLNISWFGGEPLLEFDRICRLSEEFKALEVPYSASMVTNGYLLDEEKIGKLNDLKIESIQITIDGPEEAHNRRRPHAVRGDSYRVIMANVERLLDCWPGRLSLRVNIDRSNREQFFEVRDHLQQRFLEKNLQVYPGIVRDIPRSNPDAHCQCTAEEVDDLFLELYREDNEAGGLDLYPNRSPCMANRRNSFLIGPQGEIYNCWHDVGNPDWIVGSIFPDREWNYTLLSWYMVGTEVFADEACRQCFFLPRCSGGCPHFRTRRLFQGEEINTCLPLKNRLTEFLELRYQKNARQIPRRKINREDNAMSVQSAREFLHRIENDKVLRERLETAPDLKSRWRIIQAAGGDFTLEEYEQAVKELAAAAGRELTPEDLQEIAGGAGWCACEGPHYNYLRL